MTGRERLLDVSDLEPPAPLLRTLSEVEKLVAGEYLRMRHRRDPCLLYDNLDERGYTYRNRETKDGLVEVFIWRNGDEAAAALVAEMIKSAE